MCEITKRKNSRIRLDGRGNRSYFSEDRIEGRARLEWPEKNKFTE